MAFHGRIVSVPRFAVPVVFALAAVLHAQTAFFPLKDIKPGLRGIGKTVFSGNRIDEFQVEVLGVLENIGPKQNLILARLSGGPLAETGVLQGMSGSPVYIDGRLAGAVALAFPFAKEAITGIRPIEEMVRVTEAGRTPPPGRLVARNDVSLASLFAAKDLTRLLPGRLEPATGSGKLLDIATPVSFAGFTRATLDSFAPQLRALGLEPTQGLSAGGPSSPHMGDPSTLKPGSMISVQLMTGDLSIGADGTVTYIDGNKIYAFGHRFLAVGSTALPFTRSEVLALLPVMSASFKISAPKETMGAILQDRNTAVAGELGRAAAMAPISISVSRGGKRMDNYQMEMVQDRFLSPLLVQMAVFSAIDATERTVGAATLRITGEIAFQNAPSPVRINNMFSGDNGSATQASLSMAVPVAYVMQSDFDTLRLKSVALNIEAFEHKRELTIDGLTVSRREARPGDTVRLNVSLVGQNGVETSRHLDYKIPIGAEPGPLFFTVADAGTANVTDFHQVLGATAHTPSQLISTVNNLHPNTRAYIRVWRTDPAFQLEGVDLPAPPASVTLILSESQTSLAGISQTRNSKIAEMEIDAGEVVVSGVKTAQVEIKE